MPIIEVNNVKLNYMQLSYKGDDTRHVEDLIMVHGLAANMAFWLQDFAHHFTKRFRVTLYDLRGHGRSHTTHNGYTPDDIAGDLKTLLDKLGITKAHCITHSFGGVAALKLACSKPELFSSLVIMDTHISAARVNRNDWERGKIIAGLLQQCNIDIDIHHPYFGHQFITEIAKLRLKDEKMPEVLSPCTTQILSGNSKRTAERWVSLSEETNARKELMKNDGLSKCELQKINCPILAIYGEKSYAMTTSNHLSLIWDNAEFIAIENVGHFFPREKPDIVKSLCDKFWDKLARRRAC